MGDNMRTIIKGSKSGFKIPEKKYILKVDGGYFYYQEDNPMYPDIYPQATTSVIKKAYKFNDIMDALRVVSWIDTKNFEIIECE